MLLGHPRFLEGLDRVAATIVHTKGLHSDTGSAPFAGMESDDRLLMQRPRPATSRAHLFVPSRQPIGIVAVHGHDSGPLRLDGACGLTAAKVRSNKVFHPATSGVPLPEGDPLAGTGAASGGAARPQVPTSLRVVNPVPPGRPHPSPRTRSSTPSHAATRPAPSFRTTGQGRSSSHVGEGHVSAGSRDLRLPFQRCGRLVRDPVFSRVSGARVCGSRSTTARQVVASLSAMRSCSMSSNTNRTHLWASR